MVAANNTLTRSVAQEKISISLEIRRRKRVGEVQGMRGESTPKGAHPGS